MTEHRIPLSKLAAQIRAHSIYAPSASKMWLTCSGSLIPNALSPDTAGREAAEGTVAHGVGELWLKSGRRPDHLIGTIEEVREGDQVFEIEIDEVMLDHVERYVDWCINLPGDHFVEKRVDFSDLTPIPNQTGTSDHIAAEIGKLVVSDLKYGVGVKVFAKKNTQGLLYAYGSFRELDWFYNFETITIRICQPRLDHFDVWTITREELLEFAEYAKQRAHAAWCYDAPRTPSEDGCQWCNVKKDCAAHVVMIERATDGIFENLDAEITQDEMGDAQSRLDSGDLKLAPVDPNSLTLAQKAVLYRYRKVVSDFFDEIGAELYKTLADGRPVPGWKLVDGKSARLFGNEKAATEHLQFIGLMFDEIQPRAMISPAQAEDLLVKHGVKRKQLPVLLKSIVKRLPGRPTMVPDSDKRQAISDQTEGVFDNVDEL